MQYKYAGGFKGAKTNNPAYKDFLKFYQLQLQQSLGAVREYLVESSKILENQKRIDPTLKKALERLSIIDRATARQQKALSVDIDNLDSDQSLEKLHSTFTKMFSQFYNNERTKKNTENFEEDTADLISIHVAIGYMREFDAVQFLHSITPEMSKDIKMVGSLDIVRMRADVSMWRVQLKNFSGINYWANVAANIKSFDHSFSKKYANHNFAKNLLAYNTRMGSYWSYIVRNLIALNQ